MLIKDNIKIIKLAHTTKSMVINIVLDFKLNGNMASLSIEYTPDNYKIEQTSISVYINKLLSSESFDIESLSARFVEDLYDIAVPKSITVEVSQTVDQITTKIATHKKQPGT